MNLPKVKDGDWLTVRRNFQRIDSILYGVKATPTFEEVTVTLLNADTADLSNITDGNIPYMGTGGFADSPLSYDGTDITCSGSDLIVTDSAAQPVVKIRGPNNTGAGSQGHLQFVLGTSSTVSWDVYVDRTNDTLYFRDQIDSRNVLTLDGNGLATFSNNISAVGLDLTGITNTNFPYMSVSGFADSKMTTDGTDITVTNGQFTLSHATAQPILTIRAPNNGGVGSQSHLQFNTGVSNDVLWDIYVDHTADTLYIRDQSGTTNALTIEGSAYLATFAGIVQVGSGGDSTDWDTAYSHSQVTSGNPHSVVANDIGFGVDDTPTLTSLDLTGITDGNIPYMRASAAGFGDSILAYDLANGRIEIGSVTDTNIASNTLLAMGNTTRYTNLVLVCDPTKSSAINFASGDGVLQYHHQILCEPSNELITFRAGGTNTVYIKSGTLGIRETAPVTAVEVTLNEPFITLHNNTSEDTDGGRESRLIARGQQSGAEETILGWLEFSHDGTADDEKGKLRIYLNDGNDGTTPTLAVTINSGLDMDVVGDLTAGTIQADNGFTGTGAYTNFTIVGGIITAAS